jgi:hypothetical protein
LKLADPNKIQLILVPGHMGTGGNELAGQLAREGSSHPLTELEPALSISAKVARGLITDWTSRKLEEHWQSICGQRQAKGFLKNPSVERAGELLSLSRNRLRIMIGLLTGHCHLRGHLFKLCW